MCEDGSGRVGCGPQEEFRACSDVSIRAEDGSADSVPSTDIDLLPEIEENTIDWSEDLDGPEILLYSGDNGERVAVIVLASLLTAVLLFGSIFVYYYKVRQLLSQHSYSCPLSCPPSLAAKLKLRPLPSLPSLSLPEKLAGLPSWPLSSVSLSSRLPSFLPSSSRQKRPGEASRTAAAPVPPPRSRRSRCASRASPAPPVQAVVKIPKSVLDISGPTEVTINGVTVSQSGESVMGQTLGPVTPTSRGVICDNPNLHPNLHPNLTAPARSVWAAQPALIISDQPDSSLDIPPPLPDCPPPEDSLVLSLETHRDTEA